MQRLHHLYRCAPLLLCAATAAQAQDHGPLTLSAGYTLQTDNNLFRLPASANVAALIGRSSATETIGVTSVGIGFATTQSLQQFALNASLVDYRYQNFDYLNFAARNFDAAWRWSLTPRFTGSLTSDRKETLNSFADFTGFKQRNQRTDTSTRLDTLFELAGPWRLVAGLSRSQQDNEQALAGSSDYAATTSELGLRHAFASGSAITYSAQLSNGSYLNRVVPNNSFLDDSFQQINNALHLHWSFNGDSTLDAHLTHLQRTHPTYSQRDYSGFNTAVDARWTLSGKTSLAAGYAHELSAYATATSNYSQTDRITLGPVWQFSPKGVLRLRHSWSQVDYLGNPTALTGSRRDTNRDTTLSLAWQPSVPLTFTAAVQSASRGSTAPGLDFDSTQTTLSAQYRY